MRLKVKKRKLNQLEKKWKKPKSKDKTLNNSSINMKKTFKRSRMILISYILKETKSRKNTTRTNSNMKFKLKKSSILNGCKEKKIS